MHAFTDFMVSGSFPSPKSISNPPSKAIRAGNLFIPAASVAATHAVCFFLVLTSLINGRWHMMNTIQRSFLILNIEANLTCFAEVMERVTPAGLCSAWLFPSQEPYSHRLITLCYPGCGIWMIGGLLWNPISGCSVLKKNPKHLAHKFSYYLRGDDNLIKRTLFHVWFINVPTGTFQFSPFFFADLLSAAL